MGNSANFVKYFYQNNNDDGDICCRGFDGVKPDRKMYQFLASYCPHIVLQSLPQKPFNEPFSITIHGACLLADICGFTKFSGDLCSEGVAGIDKLRRTTSTFLTKFIEIIYFYYGDGKYLSYSFSLSLSISLTLSSLSLTPLF